MRTRSILIAVGAALAAQACGSNPSGTGKVVPAAIAVDGLRSPGEWDDATAVEVFSGATLFHKVINDSLYLAFQVTDPTLTGDDILDIRFDNSHNGVSDINEDELAVNGNGDFLDSHHATTGWGIVDVHADGSSAVGTSGGVNFFELVHPLDSGDPQDFALHRGDKVGYCIGYFDDGVSTTATTFPAGCRLAGTDLSGYAVLTVD